MLFVKREREREGEGRGGGEGERGGEGKGKSYHHFLRVFRKLGSEIVEDKKVLGFPVRFFALR